MRVLAVSTLAVVVGLAGACGRSDETIADSPDRSAPGAERNDPTSSTAPVEVSTTTTTGAPLPLAAWQTPREAADLLYTAWVVGSRERADTERWAEPAELDKLFATPLVDPRNRGCDDGLGGMAQCFVANGQGGIDIDLTKHGESWIVTGIAPFSGQ